MTSVLRFPWYPWLLLVYFVLFLYSENLSLVTDAEVVYVLAGGLLAITLLWMFIHWRVGDIFKSAAMVSVISLGIVIYGHVWNLLPSDYVGMRFYVADVFLLPTMLMMVLVLIRGILLTRGLTAKLALPLNVMLVAMTVLPLYNIAAYHLTLRNSAVSTAVDGDLPPKIANSAAYPDIYYIVLDGYSSNAHLMRAFGYDNSGFTEALEARGFFVAPAATSNYGATLASIPSTLNMRYFSTHERQPNPILDLVYMRQLLADNLVARKLQALGYTYIFMLSGFTSPSTIADSNIDFYPTGVKEFSFRDASGFNACVNLCYQQSFARFFLRTTILRFLIPADNGAENYSWDSPYRALDIWRTTPEIALRPEATFSVIHLVKPHKPIVFTEDGTIIEPIPADSEAFFAQLRFINRQTLNMVDAILENSSVPPIIILQADHGSYLGEGGEDDRLVYFEVLSAFHLSGVPANSIPADITSVNTFRLLFNLYFGEQNPLLEARHFELPQGYDDIFNAVEVELAEVASQN